MRRRNFITLLGGAAATWPLAARAQVSSKRQRIAVLSGVARKVNSPIVAFERGMQELGYVDGRNIDIEYRYADGKFDRLAELAGELIKLSPSVIVAAITPAAVAARKLTQTIPIVCPLLADPIGFGLIESQSRPGGNVTGVLFRAKGLAGKQVELALELVPGLANLGFVVNVATGVIIDREELEKTCQTLSIASIPAEVSTPDDLDMAFQALARERVEAIIVLVDGMAFQERNRIAALVAAARLPAIYGFRDHVDAGGLVSYGVNLDHNFHRCATYVSKILKGARPRDLPVEFPTKLELIINNTAAKALGVVTPLSVLVRADEVIG
jgi:putative tryptophan/tyrosine transport system substrate-binding protein